MRVPGLGLLLAASVAVGVRAEPPKFYPDDPLLVDDALVDVPVKPEELELSDLYDRFGHMFKDWGQSPIGSEAVNVNTLDEVPDGSWFVNRLGALPMTVEALRRGPNRGSGPSPDGTWTVFDSKSQGLTPGFQIRDEAGHRYLIKLDPVEIPELASAAEVIATKIFHALGYHVPENYIVRFDPDNFVIEEGTEVENQFGDRRRLTLSRFREMLDRVPLDDEGRMRLVASRYIDGEPIGPFRYYGTRSDDPNDIFPHEDRRELRGLRLFAAWLNHDDSRAHNTQDSWVPVDGKHYVRHYLIDFGSTLGSGSVKMQDPELGFHPFIDPRLMKRNLLGFGFHVPLYRKADWPEFPEHQAVGRWESEIFECAAWRGNYPNPAFVRMTARDAFWAAKIMMRLDVEDLAALVETGEYSRPDDARLVLDVLRERQLDCGRFGIQAVNPLDEFRIQDGALVFANLADTYGFSSGETRYRIEWRSFDNGSGVEADLVGPVVQDEPRSPLPEPGAPELFLLARIQSLNQAFPHWEASVGVYLRPTASGYEIVGIERESPAVNTFPMS